MGRERAADRTELTGPALRARSLGARFGDRAALADFDLEVWPGEIVGLLGPNGAGKTTALRLLSTGRPPDSGTLVLLGRGANPPARDLRRRLGVAGDEPVHVDALTGWENAVCFARATGLGPDEAARRVAQLLETFLLAADAHRPVAEYSLGMRRRLLLLEALPHQPEVLVLDEPSTGLDPSGREVLVAVLRQRAAAGTAVVMATNDLALAEKLCDRVVFLRAGRAVLEGRPAELIERLGGATRFEFALAASHAPSVSCEGVEVAVATSERLVAHSKDGDRGLGTGGRSALPALCEAILREGAEIRSVVVKRPDLGDVFLRATGEEIGNRGSGIGDRG